VKTTSNPSTDGQIPPLAGPALVVDRWATWARLWFPESGLTTWVDLAEVGFEPVPAASSDAPCAN